MRDASVPDTTAPPPRRGGYDVNGRLFSDPQSSIDGIMNSILRGAEHDSTLPRLSEGPSSTPSLNGSFFGEHGPILPPSELCYFPGCEAITWMATPLCFHHLSRVRSKNKGKGKAPASLPTSPTTQPQLFPPRNPPPQTAQPGISASSSVSQLPRSTSPKLPRNAVLSPELSTTYMRRKTAPGTGPRSAPLATTPSFLPRMGQPLPLHTNGAPVTPSSRAGGESPGGSYFASSHTLPRQNGAVAHGHVGNGESSRTKDDNSENGASSILTPSESPPELRALDGSRKRSRSDFQDGSQQNQNQNQTNGVHTAPVPVPAGKDKGVEIVGNATRPTEVNGASIPPISQTSTPASNIVGNPQSQTDTAAAKEPTIAGPSSRPETAAGPSTAPKPAPSSARLGLRQSLQRRIQERDRERANNAASGQTQAPKTAMTCSLDTYIYSQGPDVAPLPPPPHVTVMSKERLEAASAAVAAPLPTAYPLSSSAASSSVDSSSASASASAKKALDYVYAHIDPRVHWTRARPKDWHDAKQKEIKARGGRKANFGKAAQRAAAARRKAAVAAAAEATAAAALESVESPMGNAATEPETYGGSVANTRSARQKEKAPAKPPPPAPVVAAPPPQVPSVWTGELPAEVTSNKPWMSLLGKFAQDEEAWRTAKQSTTQKSSGRSKRH